MEIAYKFGTAVPEDQEWTYENVWAAEATTGGGSRLVIGPSHEQAAILATLLNEMTGPFWVLYVLVVPRGRAEAGRYQSTEPQTHDAVRTLLNQFSGFLQKDGRHNLWIASESGPEMLIYDRHNVVYAYGPLAAFTHALSAMEFNEVAKIRFPSPHSHHYHQSFDSEEDRLLKYWDWHRTTLKDSDHE